MGCLSKMSFELKCLSCVVNSTLLHEEGFLLLETVSFWAFSQYGLDVPETYQSIFFIQKHNFICAFLGSMIFLGLKHFSNRQIWRFWVSILKIS